MRPHNADPGDDADRSDCRPHRRGDAHCPCDDCADERNACDNCRGNGTRWEHVEGGYLDKVECSECGGTGRSEEA